VPNGNPLPLPTRKPGRNAPASYPWRSKCSTVGSADCVALERLPDSLDPVAAWRRAFTVIHEAYITVNQTDRMPLHILLVATGLSGQPIAARTAPRNTPGLSAPKRKARSQKQVVCPRKLWQTSCLSLHASRLAAACRLRQSGRRVRGPVALPRPGCPVRRSRHPAALSKPARAPPPAAPRGILPSRPAAPPRSTPAERRAILKQQSSTKTTNQDLHTKTV